MWKCKNCKTLIEDDCELCWKCGFDKNGKASDNIEEFRQNLKETQISNNKGDINSILVLGRLIAIIFFIATVYFMFSFESNIAGFSIIFIISTFSNAVFFLMLSEILNTLIKIQKKK